MSDPKDSARQNIDQIDSKIVDLLDQRAKLSLDLQKAKEENDESVFSAIREATVLANVQKTHQGPFPASSLKSVFGEIVSACRNLQSQDRQSPR